MADLQPFRFLDNREKYLLFANTCSEPREAARRIGLELEHLEPRPPALGVFQTGAGEGTLLNLVLRELHYRWPTVPFRVVVKETSGEFIRMALRHLADRFKEHPELVLVFTNLPYREAALLGGDGSAAADDPDRAARLPPGLRELRWRHVALPGNTAHDFDTRINAEFRFLTEHWGPVTRSGHAAPGARAASPWAVVLYRADHAFALERVIAPFAARPGAGAPGRRDRAPGPLPGREGHELVIAFQPYRSRLDAGWKVRNVLAPLARSLSPGGRMITIQSTGRDPGMEIIESIWPGEDPFPTPRGALADALRVALSEGREEDERPRFRFEGLLEQESEFRFHLQLNPDDVESSIGTSTLLAAWNAAAYVAQIEEERVVEAMTSGRYIEATNRVLRKYHGLWFTDECFVVVREPGP